MDDTRLPHGTYVDGAESSLPVVPAPIVVASTSTLDAPGRALGPTRSPLPRRWARAAVTILPWALVIPALLGGETIRARRLRRRRWASAGLSSLVGLTGVALVRWQLGRWFTVQPPFELERAIGALEIRQYAPLLIAETRVEHTVWREALEIGYQRLARYIRGENLLRRRIPMTSPVLARRDGDGHTVAFIAPSGPLGDASLALPADTRIALRSIGKRRIAVRRFRGDYGADHIRALQRDIVHDVLQAGLTPLGEPHFAGYDPPTTLPFLRRVEVWVEVA